MNASCGSNRVIQNDKQIHRNLAVHSLTSNTSGSGSGNSGDGGGEKKEKELSFGGPGMLNLFAVPPRPETFLLPRVERKKRRRRRGDSKLG